MAEPYARKVTSMLVGQMADVAGFDVAHGNAVDAVADVMLRFIEEVGRNSKEYAELQGRTDVNALDVVEALQDFNMDCNDLFQFAKEEPSDPFLHTLSPFPVHRTALQPPTFDQAGNERPSYIPAHLPAFPAAHTMQFTPIQPQEPDQTAVADEAPREAGTALQSQQALIRLQQKMQASSGAVRPNPFLALQSKKAPAQQGEAQQDVVPPSAEGQSALDVVDAFGPVLKRSRPEGEQQGGDVAAGAAAAAGPTGAAADGRDSEMVDADAPGSPGGGWDAEEVDAAALREPEDVLGGRVLLSLDPAGRCLHLAMKERYTKSAQDAFLKAGGAAAAAAAGGSRRRGAAQDPDSAKRARAQDILARGPDAILMEYPEGHVPRSGT